MRLLNILRTTIVAFTCVGIAVPTTAATPAPVTVAGIPVRQHIEDIVLHNGELRGAVVDNNGKPVTGSAVAIGQSGKVISETATDSEGRFAVQGLNAGTYQIATYAGVQNYRLWKQGTAPAQAKQGVVHVMSDELARGNCNTCNTCNTCNDPCSSRGGCSSNPLVAAITSPKVLAVALVAGVVAGIVIAADDDAS